MIQGGQILWIDVKAFLKPLETSVLSAQVPQGDPQAAAGPIVLRVDGEGLSEVTLGPGVVPLGVTLRYALERYVSSNPRSGDLRIARRCPISH